VTLTIRDDGRGLPMPFLEGVGVAAMRERAAELGGELSVGPAEEGGTIVAAGLPVGS
jgi:two-component system NarL family sensor kinase